MENIAELEKVTFLGSNKLLFCLFCYLKSAGRKWPSLSLGVVGISAFWSGCHPTGANHWTGSNIKYLGVTNHNTVLFNRLIPSPHHSLFQDMTSQASAPSLGPQVMPDYYPPMAALNYQSAPLPQLSSAGMYLLLRF